MNFDFIVGVSIGSMIAKIIINKDHVAFSGIIALITFALITISTSYLNLKSYSARRIINAKTKKNINNIEEVFYVDVDQNKKLIISKKYPDDFNPENKFGIE